MESIVQAVARHLSSSKVFVFFGLCAAWLIIVSNYFPFFGVALSLAGLSTLVYFNKTKRTFFITAVYILSLLFCVALIYRSNEGLTFFNFIAVIILGSILTVSSEATEKNQGFIETLLSPVRTLFGAFQSSYTYKFDLPKPQNVLSHVDNKKSWEIIKSFGVAALLLIIIIPLLASANPLFEKWVQSSVSWLNISTWFSFFDEDAFAMLVYRLFLAAFLIWIVPKLVVFAKAKFEEKDHGEDAKKQFNFLIPKIAVIAVLGVFFISQAQLYFASESMLQSLGYSHAEYTREVFGQLTVVAFITLVLLYNDKKPKGLSQVLTYVLLIEAAFLTGIAFKSVYDYSSHWGLTYKRLWGFTGVAWMIATLASFLYIFKNNLREAVFVKTTLFISCAVLLGVNLFNFDYLIYYYGQSTTHEGTDYRYLSRLTPDSFSYQNQYKAFTEMDPYSKELASSTRYSALTLADKIEYLQNKYKDIDVRTFNFSEFQQYMVIKSIDIATFKQTWNQAIAQTYPPTSSSLNEGLVTRDNPQGRFFMRSDFTTLYPFMSYYFVTSPSSVEVALTPDQIIDEHRLATDVWEQAGLSFSARSQAVALSPLAADSIVNGTGEEVGRYLLPDETGIPVFIVKSLPNNERGKSTYTASTGAGYILITEQAFGEDGRILAQLIGEALGLQRGVGNSGLMGDRGYFDITEPDIQTVRSNAVLVENRNKVN